MVYVVKQVYVNVNQIGWASRAKNQLVHMHAMVMACAWKVHASATICGVVRHVSNVCIGAQKIAMEMVIA